MEQTLVETLARADRRQVRVVRIVGDEHELRLRRLPVDGDAERVPMRDHDRPRAEARERLTPPPVAFAPVDETCVQPQRDVVQEQPAVGPADVDPPLDPLERPQRPDWIPPVEPHVPSEVIPRSVRNTDERNTALQCNRGDRTERSVAAGDPDHVGGSSASNASSVLTLPEHARLDAPCPCGAGKVVDARHALSGARVDEEETAQTASLMGLFVARFEPFGPWRCPAHVPIITGVSELGLHRIEDDLNESWLEDWAGAGVAEIEALLAKHAAFLSFLESQEA